MLRRLSVSKYLQTQNAACLAIDWLKSILNTQSKCEFSPDSGWPLLYAQPEYVSQESAYYWNSSSHLCTVFKHKHNFEHFEYFWTLLCTPCFILTGNKTFFWCLCVWLECGVLNLRTTRRSVRKECMETSSAPEIKNQLTINTILLHHCINKLLLWRCTDLAVLLGHMRDVVFFLRVARLTLCAAPALDIWSLGDLSFFWLSSPVLLVISSPVLPIRALHLH